jgi:hypothetical protein
LSFLMDESENHEDEMGKKGKGRVRVGRSIRRRRGISRDE